MLYIGTEDTFGDVLVMGRELCDGLQIRKVARRGHLPDIAVALVVGGHQ